LPVRIGCSRQCGLAERRTVPYTEDESSRRGQVGRGPPNDPHELSQKMFGSSSPRGFRSAGSPDLT
jgi:hypothetical protein